MRAIYYYRKYKRVTAPVCCWGATAWSHTVFHPTGDRLMRNYCYLTALAGSLVLVGAPASAQPGVTLEEIVVTARKREENLMEVPVSISVINASLIQEAGIIEPRDFFELTPGLDFDTNGDRNNATPSVNCSAAPRPESWIRPRISNLTPANS